MSQIFFDTPPNIYPFGITIHQQKDQAEIQKSHPSDIALKLGGWL